MPDKPVVINTCPCNSGKTYHNCCKPLIERQQPAGTAESLMRSRYTAFTLCNEDYLRFSWHPDFCPKNIHTSERTKWLGLKIVSTQAGGYDEQTGQVEFIARYKNNGKVIRLHENSQFKRYENRWVYTHAVNI